MAKLQPPEKFPLKPVEWTEWIEVLGHYRRPTKLHKEDGKSQRDTLIYVIGGKQANKILKTLKFRVVEVEDPAIKKTVQESDTDYEVLVRKFTGYFIPKRNIIHERSHLHEKSQGKDETVQEFAPELHMWAQYCGCKDQDDQIRDRFVVGLNETIVRQKLELIDDLTLDRAITIARQHEQVKSQLAHQNQQLTQEVGEARSQPKRFSGKKEFKPRSTKTRSSTAQQASKTPEWDFQGTHGQCCQRCGYESHQTESKCPTNGKTCKKCNKLRHFAAMCRSKANNRSDEVAIDRRTAATVVLPRSR